MVEAGELGEVRVVQTEFAHGNCATAVEQHSEGAAWRNDPQTSGGTVLGDEGTLALHLATFITGQHVHQVATDFQNFVEGRVLEDNTHVLLRFEEGASGYFEALSNICSDFEQVLMARLSGKNNDAANLGYPTLEYGAHVVKFIVSFAESTQNKGY